jgi:hypothetical protein
MNLMIRQAMNSVGFAPLPEGRRSNFAASEARR